MMAPGRAYRGSAEGSIASDTICFSNFDTDILDGESAALGEIIATPALEFSELSKRGGDPSLSLGWITRRLDLPAMSVSVIGDSSFSVSVVTGTGPYSRTLFVAAPAQSQELHRLMRGPDGSTTRLVARESVSAADVGRM